MLGVLRSISLTHPISLLVPVLGLLSCSSTQPPSPAPAPAAGAQQAAPIFTSPLAVPRQEPSPRVMLGIDVLEAEGFTAVKGKRLGLLTHPAGVNRHGISTIEVLRRAPGVQLVALYAVEHGLYNDLSAEKTFPDMIDRRTGLMVYSLYSDKRRFRPTPEQLKPIDAFVIDLQDVGTRSYTFIGAMKTAMEACFEAGKEVIVLDRPNPLGGYKVDGPLLEPHLMTDVGRFRVPYVHGLTMGELALMAKSSLPPGGIAVSDAVRSQSRLTVIPMRGWTRSMRWPETGLRWVPTSTMIQDFNAVQGYAMTGLGCILGGFRHGIGKQHPFRGIKHLSVRDEIVERELRALPLAGIQVRRVSVPNERSGQPTTGLFIEISDYDAWQPTDLSFHLMRLACQLEPRNPFANATPAQRRTFLIHVGSTAFFNDLVANGRNVDVEAWIRTWREQGRVYQNQSRRYWLYR
jgi:uncharacterized protein YbbC (DUF1343 family)